MSKTFKVVNVVAVMNCGFVIRLRDLWNSPHCVAVHEANGGKGNVYTHIKAPKSSKNVTVFYNGNMISVGNKTIAEARRNLNATKDFLKSWKHPTLSVESKPKSRRSKSK